MDTCQVRTARADLVRALPPGYTYMQPVVEILMTPRDVFPERVSPYREYPRDVLPPQQPSKKSVALVDYEIRISDPDDHGYCLIEVWLMPPPVYTGVSDPFRLYWVTASAPISQDAVDRYVKIALTGR